MKKMLTLVIVAACCLGTFPSENCLAQVKSQNEPTNAAEAAAKKAAADKVIDERYQAWKAKLPADQQAWETVLEQNLGSFYLPIHKSEKVAGKSNAWDFVRDDPKLPRVLLIGDSISRGYTLDARKALAGKANVHRAPENCGPTANGVKKIESWLGDGKWDVIHFNFGIHDQKTPAADYEQRLETLIARMKRTGAKLIFATTTPVPPDTKDGPEMVTRIAEKNEIALRAMKKHSVAIDDLHAFLAPQLEGIANPKDVHFNAKGYELMGQQVAKSIEAALKHAGDGLIQRVGAGTVTAEPASAPAWDLAKDAFAATTGRVERVDGRVMMDGESAFAIPNSAIQDPSCFTITMDIRFGEIGGDSTLRLLDQLISDTGFAVDAFKWGVVTTVNGITYEQNRFLATSNQVWKFVFAVRDGVVAEYQNNASGPQYLLRISPNLAPIWVGRTPARKGMKALSGYEILSLKVYGPDTKYYLPGESADTLKNGYIGGPGWLIRLPGKIDKPLPRILYYGDSISHGYGEPFSTLMKDKAYCYHWSHFVGGVGGFPTAAFEAAAAAAPFDIIIFNNGLHSLKWSPDKVTDAQIEAVLRNMVQGLRKGAPKAKLVWASTTPHTAKGSPVTGVGELNPIVIRINTLAEKVMKEEGVDSVDLYALLIDRLNLASGDQFHWSNEAYQLIAEALQKKCDALLPRSAAAPGAKGL